MLLILFQRQHILLLLLQRFLELRHLRDRILILVQHRAIIVVDLIKVFYTVQKVRHAAGSEQRFDQCVITPFIHKTDPFFHALVLLLCCFLRHCQIGCRLIDIRFLLGDLVF